MDQFGKTHRKSVDTTVKNAVKLVKCQISVIHLKRAKIYIAPKSCEDLQTDVLYGCSGTVHAVIYEVDNSNNRSEPLGGHVPA